MDVAGYRSDRMLDPFSILLGNFRRRTSTLLSQSSQSPFPRLMAHRAASISISIDLGHASANAVKATAGAGPLVAPRA